MSLPKNEQRNVSSCLFARNDVKYGIRVKQAFSHAHAYISVSQGDVLVLIHRVQVFKTKTEEFTTMKLTSRASLNTR